MSPDGPTSLALSTESSLDPPLLGASFELECNMRPPGMSESDVERVRSWAGAQPLVAAIYCFGSRARGDHTDLSDLDLAVRANATPS